MNQSSNKTTSANAAAITTSTIPVLRHCVCEKVAAADDTRLPWDYAVLCSACCKRALRSSVKRHEEALMARDLAREECAKRLAELKLQYSESNSEDNNITTNSTTTTTTSGRHCHFSELQFQSQQLRERQNRLQQQCAALAVEVAAHAVENEERQASLNPQAEYQRRQLRRLEAAVCEGSLAHAIEAARDRVRMLRFQWALQAFRLHRLSVRQEDLVDSSISKDDTTKHHTEDPISRRRSSVRSKEGRPKQARGIGKIGGLPLPNAGPELYGVLPPQELQSALRLVASISNTVARCLGILLPHPVLLHFSSPASQQQGDIIHSVLPKHITMQQQQQQPVNDEDPSDPTSTDALLALLESDLNDNTTNQERSLRIEQTASTTIVPPSMDPALVTQRLRHAMAAIMADSSAAITAGSASVSSTSSSSKSTQYALAAEVLHDDEFAVALQLLQNNVIALCIRAGVPVAKLWPAEAVLLNLYALQVFCEDQVKQQLKE